MLPERKADVNYLDLPIAPVIGISGLEKSNNIIFIGRLSMYKGYHLLPLIARKIEKRLHGLNWYIVGEALEEFNNIPWDDNIKIIFCGQIHNEEVLQILRGMKCIILPSIAEGMPVCLIEAMKSGVIPVVNDINGGVQEIISNGETGYRIAENNVDVYAEKIIELFTDVEKWEYMSRHCITKANARFDSVNNTKAIEDCFLSATTIIAKKKPRKIYGSRLDRPWISNNIVKIIRSIH